MQPQITAAQQVDAINKQLLQAFASKEDAQAKLKEAEANIVALRNLLAGVGVGQNLQKEIDAQKSLAPAP